MDIKMVAEKTLRRLSFMPESGDPACGRKHIRYMLTLIIEGHITGEKAHRWLGWAQACICMQSNVSLQELKEINRS